MNVVGGIYILDTIYTTKYVYVFKQKKIVVGCFWLFKIQYLKGSKVLMLLFQKSDVDHTSRKMPFRKTGCKLW